MYCSVFVLAFAGPLGYGDDWTPPENPDPAAILQEARADTQAKRFETALAKHVWFHDNALSITPALYGVRLSFALADWAELAEQYPPALTRLKEMRDQARQKVLEGNNVRESFHDMKAINNQLGEHAATKEVFETLDEKNPESAKQVFDIAKPALVRAKAYSLLGKYVEPKADFELMTLMYREGKKRADAPRFGARYLDFANKSFANEVTTLVAILVVNDRTKEAEEIAKSARAEWEDRAFLDGLEQALAGVVPEPWP